MKTLSLNEMESVGGKGIVGGACAVLGLSAAGAAGRFAMARLGMTVFFFNSSLGSSSTCSRRNRLFF